MMKNVDRIDYTKPSHRDRHFGYNMDAYRYENLFFKIHPDLREIRDLKENTFSSITVILVILEKQVLNLKN